LCCPRTSPVPVENKRLLAFGFEWDLYLAARPVVRAIYFRLL